MSSRPSPFQDPTHPENIFPALSAIMGGAYRSPSPAPEAYLSSAENTPRTASRIRSGLFDDSVWMNKHQIQQSHYVNTAVPTRDAFRKEQHGMPKGVVAEPLTATPRPQTPTSKRIQQNWHGLPSPRTPSCKSNFSKEQSADQTPDFVGVQDDQVIDGFWTGELTEHNVKPTFSPTTPRCDLITVSSDTVDLIDSVLLPPPASIEGDAKLAFELSSPSSIRRSTRLRNQGKMLLLDYIFKILLDKLEAADKSKVKTKAGKTHVKHPSLAPQQAVLPLITQAEPDGSPFDIAIASSLELPALYSTQWQLMYPPGGSTHPAYPWPTIDPRLVFRAHHVPLNNGLPDTSHVPTLALPMGWHQACWSGLHPIVFDPYRQAFKLTPVGPLPLTSEEVHQGGLQNYVPGGRLHPEFGMLPLLSILSDGSDAEVYNFDGVDWSLPWAHVGGIPEVKRPRSSPTLSDSALSASYALPIIHLPPRYLETRDCPDDVFDLQDGWRWLLTMEQALPGDFVPTPGRKWHGTGVRRTSRRTKQPIAALMAITMAEDDENNTARYIGNQNLRDFCPFKSVATPVHINITLLDDVEFTLVELLSYFPHHYQWRKAGERMVRAGLNAIDVSNFINMSRRLPGASICSSKSVNYHVSRKFEDDVAAEGIMQFSTDTTSYTAEQWTYSVWETTDYPLLALTHGLVELPSGVDAGPLTTLIRWIRDQGRYRTMLSEVPAILKEAKIEALIDPGEGGDPDIEVVDRYVDSLRKDRRRVLKELQALKEKEEIETDAAETAKGKNHKKRKLEEATAVIESARVAACL